MPQGLHILLEQKSKVNLLKCLFPKFKTEHNLNDYCSLLISSKLFQSMTPFSLNMSKKTWTHGWFHVLEPWALHFSGNTVISCQTPGSITQSWVREKGMGRPRRGERRGGIIVFLLTTFADWMEDGLPLSLYLFLNQRCEKKFLLFGRATENESERTPGQGRGMRPMRPTYYSSSG